MRTPSVSRGTTLLHSVADGFHKQLTEYANKKRVTAANG